MLEVSFAYDSSLDNMDEAVRLAIAEKLTELTRLLYEKVVENLSGKLLQKQSGELLGSIRQEVSTGGEVMVGTVFPDPASPKAWALEHGGKGFYAIVPTKASILRFIGKDGEKVFARYVNHPPSKAYAYLGSALEEMREQVPIAFQEAIQQVLDRGKA